MGVRKMRGVECGRKTQDAPPIDIVRVGFLKKNVRREDTFIIPRKYFIKWNEQNMMGGGGRGEGQPTSLSPIIKLPTTTVAHFTTAGDRKLVAFACRHSTKVP